MSDSKIDIKSIGPELVDIQKDFRQRVENLAYDIRKDIIVPLCKEKDLEFKHYETGYYFLTNKTKYAIFNYRSILAEEFGLTEIMQVLDLHVDPLALFGAYVEDVVKGVDY
jgi:hypothetical protein